MNLGLVLGGVAKGATDTYTMLNEQDRLNQAAKDKHVKPAAAVKALREHAASGLVVGQPIGSNGPSVAAPDGMDVGLVGSSYTPPATTPTAPAPAPYGLPSPTYPSAPAAPSAYGAVP